MIRAQDGGTNDVVLDVLHEALGDEEVVQAPADVLGSGVVHVAPERVGAGQLRIEVTECVDEAQRQQLGEPITLLLSEAGVLLVRLRIRQVHFLMGNIHVTSDYHRLLLVQLLDVGVEDVVPFQALVQGHQTATRVDDVDGNDEELFELGGDHALLVGEARVWEVEDDLFRLDFTEKANSAEALAKVPVSVIAFDLELLWDILEGSALDFLWIRGRFSKIFEKNSTKLTFRQMTSASSCWK